MAISWLTMIFMLVYISSNWLVRIMIKKFGLRIGVFCGALFNMVGAWIKCASMEIAQPPGSTDFSARSSFAVLMIGQAVSGLTQSFVLSVPPELAVTWFSVREVTMATSLGVFANQVCFILLGAFAFHFQLFLFIFCLCQSSALQLVSPCHPKSWICHQLTCQLKNNSTSLKTVSESSSTSVLAS